MSYNFGKFYKGAFAIIALSVSMVMLACDPCRQLAEKICDCRESEEERKKCKGELSLAGQHKYFKESIYANSTEVCEKALQQCSCKKINNHQDDQCGMYRLDIK